MVGALLVVLLLGCWLVRFLFRRKARLRLARDLPGDDGLPLLGHAIHLMKLRSISELLSVLLELTDRYAEKGFMKFWFVNLLAIGVWEPEYIEVIANSPITAEKGNIYKLIFGDLMKGIFVSNGARCRELRRPLCRTFTRRLLEQEHHPVFVRRARELLEYLDPRAGPDFDIAPTMGALSLDIFAETQLGLHLNDLKERTWNIAHYSNEFFSTMFQVKMKFHFYFWKIFYKFTKFSKALDEILQKHHTFMQWILDERKKSTNQRKDGAEYYPDFVLRRGRELGLSQYQMRSELVDVIIGGVDTLASAASSALVFLAMFPEVQEAVYQEQAGLLGDRDPEPRDLPGMVYLERVIKETLRHVAPPGVIKTTSAELQLGGYKVPANTVVYLFQQRTHRDPRFWERPHHFHPDHFLPEQEAARPRHAYGPFGWGPRSCLGAHFAMSAMKVIISLVIRRFKLSTELKFKEIVYDYKVLLDMGQYPVSFTRR